MEIIFKHISHRRLGYAVLFYLQSHHHSDACAPARPSLKALSAKNGGMSSSLWLETIILLMHKFIFSSHHLSPSTFSFPNHYTQRRNSIFLLRSYSVVVTCSALLLFHSRPLTPTPTCDGKLSLLRERCETLCCFHSDIVKEKNYVEIWVLMALLVPLWLFTPRA